ncbi:MAG: efflux transporter outer membrane subunit [Proteobacteria bacterium]|nr:efflux transporter outer membrane subunit [Pseudomonadota bacterium]
MVLLGGCEFLTVGPRYHRPQLQVPAQYKEVEGWKPAQPQDTAARGDWWAVFADADLDALIRQVEVSNQNVALALGRYDQALALLGGARAQYLPTIGADASVTRGQNSQIGTGASTTSGVGRRTTNLFRADLTVSWELDVWGRIRRNVEANREAAQASAADLAAALLSAQATLAQSYFQLRITDMELDLLAGSMEAYQKALDVTQARYDAGVAQRTDVTQAQTQFENAHTQWLDLGITRATLEHAIAVLVGKPPAALSLARRHDTPTVPAAPLLLPSQLLERRPDIAASERRVAAANAQIGVAEAAWFPTLTLGGSGGYQSDAWNHLFSLPNRFWSLGPGLALTLLDFGGRRSQVRQARALYDQSVAGYRQIVLSAFQNVEDALVNVRVLHEEAVSQHKAAEAAALTLSITQDQYKAGTVDYLNVVAAQNASLAAERAWREITARQLTQTVSLLTSLGGGWDTQQLPLR